MNKQYSGKLNIVIRDAKTGEIKQEVSADNMITDAVVSILNSSLARREQRTSIYNTKSIIQLLMGGVMLFNSAIDETHIVPNPAESETMIGNANDGTTISGSNLKGDFISATIDKDGAEFVWEFDSTHGNGTIAAICLTSNQGGELGCKIQARDENNVSNSFTDFFTNLEPSDDEDFEEHCNALGSGYIDEDTGQISTIYQDPGVWVFNSTGKVNKFDVPTYGTGYKYEANLKQGYNLNRYYNDARFAENYDYYVKKEQFTPPSNNLKIIGGPVSSKAYAAYAEAVVDEQYNESVVLHLATYSGTSGHVRDIDISSMVDAIIADYANHGSSDYFDVYAKATAINYAIEAGAVKAYGDYLYWFVGNISNPADSNDFVKICVLEPNGGYSCVSPSSSSPFYNLIRECSQADVLHGVLWSNSQGCEATNIDIFAIGEDIYLYAGGYYFYIDNNIKAYPHMYLKDGKKIMKALMKDSFSDIPYYRILGDSGIYYEASSPLAYTYSLEYTFTKQLLRLNYLATICNLQTPVVKTSADTLTLTYTIQRTQNNSSEEEEQL